MLDILGRGKKKRLRKSVAGKIADILATAGVDLVLDVGANLGQTRDKLRAAGYAGRIVSFEPVPAAHAELERRAAVDPAWRIAPRMALGAAAGEVVINVSQASDMSSVLSAGPQLLEALPKTRVVGQVTAPLAALDDLLDDYCPAGATAFLKIDTQGFERQVLAGARATLGRVAGVQLELSLFPLYEGEETYLGFLADFHAWGFVPHLLVETNYSRALHRQLQIDVVFMRETPPSPQGKEAP